MDNNEAPVPGGEARFDARPRPLDRNSPLPLWAQLVEELTRRLAAGAFAERLPTDYELMQTYDVGRQTVREAVRRLGESFRLERRRGKGTFLREPQFQQQVGTMYSWFQAIESQGAKQESVVRSRDLRVDAIVAGELSLPADEPLFYLERLRMAGDAPLALDRTWMPADLAAPVLEVDFTHTALYDELQQRAGIVPTRGEERISPVIPTPAIAKLLEMPKGAAAFAIVRKTWVGERPLERRETIVRGDRHTFVSTWPERRGDSSREPFLRLVSHI
jgi:GntR family transcriptional regulator